MGKSATAEPSAFERVGPRRAAAVLVLLVLLLGALAGALSDTARGSSTLRGGAASVAISVAGTLVGLFVIVATAVLIYSLLSRPRSSPSSEEPVKSSFWRRIAVVLVIGAIALIVTLLSHPRARHSPANAGPHGPGLSGRAPHSSPVHFVPSASAGTIAVVALVVAVVVLAHWLRARRLGAAWNLGQFLRGDEAPIALAPSLLARSLGEVHVPDPEEETDPRKAVVAAYIAMTHAAAAAGAERGAHETPSEFLQRLLSSLGASHRPARHLTFLFETARYSTKPFEETLRSDAITALRQVQLELAPPVPAVSGSGASGSGASGSGPSGSGASGSGPSAADKVGSR